MENRLPSHEATGHASSAHHRYRFWQSHDYWAILSLGCGYLGAGIYRIAGRPSFTKMAGGRLAKPLSNRIAIAAVRQRHRVSHGYMPLSALTLQSHMI